ncbi:MAG: 2-phosphosulfolactate phosphatase [Gemmatimonadetes bacterium]|nr:2-phosphosulfolactate phosphatase [Gemmatimonadota bacterium]
MKLSVYFTPYGLTAHDIQGRPVLVIDVLRATTTIVTALGNGAKAVLPASGADDAIRLANNLERDDVLLAGEQGYRPIEGFACGNSPTEMTAEKVAGMTLVMTTTNGTSALLATDHGDPVFVGAPANFSAAAARAREALEAKGELIILCSGREGRFALEDAYVAGRFAREILPSRAKGVELDDAAIAAQQLVRRYGDRWKGAVGASVAARRLKELGLGADVAAATEVDKFDIVPQYAERQVRI